MKEIGFMGSPPNAHSFDISTDENFVKSGRNLGNYAFWNAVDSHIDGSKLYFDNWEFRPELANERCSVFVIPCSNFIHPNRDLGPLASRLEKLNIPIVLLGLGVQELHGKTAFEVPKGTLRFIDFLNDRKSIVTVRGENSASRIFDLGLRSLEVLGCPSNLTNKDPDLGRKIGFKLEELLKNRMRNCVFNFDFHRRSMFGLREDLARLFVGVEPVIICQNPISHVRFGRGEVEKDSEYLYQADFWNKAKGISDFESFVKSCFFSFFSANSWLEFLRRFDFSIGTRFHGNMLSFQAGVPAVFIGHDSRTSELADYHLLPKIDLSSFSGASSMESVLRALEFSGEDYDKKRATDAGKYRKIYLEHGLTYAPWLDKF
jgi:hypothetical protein